jgi:hypothetical protein
MPARFDEERTLREGRLKQRSKEDALIACAEQHSASLLCLTLASLKDGDESGVTFIRPCSCMKCFQWENLDRRGSN